MAVTETPPETVDAVSAAATSSPRPQPTGLAAVLGSGDHKVIGRMFVVASLLFGALVLVLGEAFAVEATKPETLDVFSSDVAYQLFTLLRVGTVFLLALPITIGIAMVVVPLQVGSHTVAFPRAAAASFWGWLLGSILLLSSYAMNGGPGGGSEAGINLWIASMVLVVVSLLLAAICLATTVLALRTTGMSLERTPLFSWSIAVAAIMWLVTLPVLVGLLVLMYVDHRHAGGIAFGSADALYPALAWMFRNPQVYVVAIPVLGFVADVLATASGARLKLRGAAQSAIAVFGALSFGAFLVMPNEDVQDSLFVTALSLVSLLAVLIVGLACADGIRRGRFAMNGGVAYAVAAYLALLLGVFVAAIGTLPGVLDAPDGATTSNNILFLGVTHAAVLAGLIAALGGVHWWATKIGRRPATETIGMLAPLILLAGTALVVIPDVISGITGEGIEIYGDYTGGISGLNIVVAVGVAIVGLGLLTSVISLLPVLKRPEEAAATDPWGGQTLEWLTASPPSLGNFDAELAVVTSAEPLLDLREEK